MTWNVEVCPEGALRLVPTPMKTSALSATERGTGRETALRQVRVRSLALLAMGGRTMTTRLIIAFTKNLTALWICLQPSKRVESLDTDRNQVISQEDVHKPDQDRKAGITAITELTIDPRAQDPKDLNLDLDPIPNPDLSQKTGVGRGSNRFYTETASNQNRDQC
jgi:hypothetical protein